VNRHNECTWDTENPCVAIQQVLDSPKLNIFCATSNKKQYRPFIVAKPTVTDMSHLDYVAGMVNATGCQDKDNFISQHNKAPPHPELPQSVFSPTLDWTHNSRGAKRASMATKFASPNAM
jgi:hypothetical protein